MPDPPNALRLVALGVLGTCRLPTRSPPPRLPPMPPAPRLSRVPAPGPAPRLAMSRLPAPGLVPRFPIPPAGCCRAWFCRALACRLAIESPRVVPPNLLAVFLSPYGAPPRCCGLCCQLLLPLLPPFARFPPLTRLLLLTKLLLLLMVTLLLPPHPEL